MFWPRREHYWDEVRGITITMLTWCRDQTRVSVYVNPRRHSLSILHYIANGYYHRSYRVFGLVLDVTRPTLFTDVIALMKTKRGMH
jgi:hypothetical protein